MINRRRSGARGTPAKVNATAGLEASEGVNSASVSDGSHESVYLGPFYVPPPFKPHAVDSTKIIGLDQRATGPCARGQQQRRNYSLALGFLI